MSWCGRARPRRPDAMKRQEQFLVDLEMLSNFHGKVSSTLGEVVEGPSDPAGAGRGRPPCSQCQARPPVTFASQATSALTRPHAIPLPHPLPHPPASSHILDICARISTGTKVPVDHDRLHGGGLCASHRGARRQQPAAGCGGNGRAAAATGHCPLPACARRPPPPLSAAGVSGDGGGNRRRGRPPCRGWRRGRRPRAGVAPTPGRRPVVGAAAGVVGRGHCVGGVCV